MEDFPFDFLSSVLEDGGINGETPMSAYTETKAVADAGLAAGQSLWAAMEAAYAASESLQHKRLVRLFECALETITDELGDEAALFAAHAMQAIPNAMLDGVARTIIARTASNTWGAYYDARLDDAEAQAADFRADAAKDAA